jgi:hypothetical protein
MSPRLRESRFWRAYDRSRYAILFFALLLTLILVPAATTIGLPSTLITSFLAFTLIAAVMPNTTRTTRWVVLVPTVLLVILRVGADRMNLPDVSALAQVAIGLVGLIAVGAALRFVIRSGAIDNETIYASLSTYLLAGLFFGQIYWAIEQLAPGSFSGPDPLTNASAVYYSFVTLATLGYGDFLPRTDIARGIATFEVIGGQLYLAVLVARLIGLFKSKGDAR